MGLNRNISAVLIIFLTAAVVYPGGEHLYNAAPAKANLKLRLWGTITGSNISAYAIIEDTTTRKQKLYKKSDEIQNATVIMIFREKVVLRVGDHLEILEIETGRPEVNAKDKYGVTALIDASFKGQKEIVELLILEGADLDARDRQGNTALMNAALKGHIEIVELLISNGADVSVKDNSGNTALIDSAKYARDSACEIIALLKDNDADVNAKNNFGLTALIYAAQGGHVENIECLIAEGADVNAKSKSGETALKFAEMSDREDIIDLLKENGAKE
jgi:ankyrin repeat protein